MRANILSLTITTFIGSSAFAQEIAPADSIAKAEELQEVVVVGANQTAKAGEMLFRPTERQKKVSANGYDLLRHMAMPQISVDPSSDKVTTLAGGGVSTFINGLPASDIEVKNLRTKNVLRVDYLEYPSDPRFQGAPYVINFIVQMPEWGGYTRLSAYSSLFRHTSAGTNMFTKFICKRMSYDLYLGWYFFNDHHFGYEQKDVYSLLTPDNELFIQEQTRNTNYTRQRGSGLPVNLRAIYNSNNFRAINSVYFSFSDMPANISKGTMYLQPETNRDMRFHESSATDNKNAGWNGYFSLDLDKGVSLSMSNILQYDKNKYNRLYETTLNHANTGIVTNSSEDAWCVYTEVTASKQLGKAHSVGINYFVKYDDYDIDYTGSTTFNTRMKSTNTGGSINYSGQFPMNLKINGYIGLAWNRSNSNGKSNCYLYPTFRINASYAPTQKHQINLTVKTQTNGSSASYKTSDILQSSDFMYKTGNPYLTSYSVIMGQATYSWFASNKLQLYALTDIAMSINKVCPFYSHYLNGQAILQSYHNNGDNYLARLEISTTYKPVSSLQFQLFAGYQHMKLTGQLHRSVNQLYGRLNASYYFGDFFVSLMSQLNGSTLDLYSGMLNQPKPFYQLRGGWSKGNWHVDVSANNIFNNSWKGNRTELITPLYSQYSEYRDGSYHRSLTVGVTYTFDYGKKIKRENEVGAHEGSNSAILK